MNGNSSVNLDGGAGYARLGLVQAACYTPIVLLGVVGNCYVIIMIIRIFQTSKVRAGVYIYVLTLSLMDLIFLTGASWLVLYIYLRSWILGSFMCRVYWLTETINKTYSVYVLVILSIDRYRAISQISEYETKNYKAAIRLVLCVMAPIAVTNMPLYVYAGYTEGLSPDGSNETIGYCQPMFPDWPLKPGVALDHGNASSTDDSPAVNTMSYYMQFLFILYFVIPCSLIITSYALLLKRLQKPQHSAEFASNTIGQSYIQRRLARGGKVVKSIFLVVAFYLFCWTPYWMFQLVMTILKHEQTHGGAVYYIQTIIYSLPYVNSGLNPILYGFLNRSLRRAYRDSIHRLRIRRLTKGDLTCELKNRKAGLGRQNAHRCQRATTAPALPLPALGNSRLFNFYSQIFARRNTTTNVRTLIANGTVRLDSEGNSSVSLPNETTASPTVTKSTSTAGSRQQHGKTSWSSITTRRYLSTIERELSTQSAADCRFEANAAAVLFEQDMISIDLETWLLYFSRETLL